MVEYTIILDDETNPEFKMIPPKLIKNRIVYNIKKLSERGSTKTKDNIEKCPTYALSHRHILGAIHIPLPRRQLSIELLFRYMRHREDETLSKTRILPANFIAFDYSDFKANPLNVISKVYDAFADVTKDVSNLSTTILIDTYIDGIPSHSTIAGSKLGTLLNGISMNVGKIGKGLNLQGNEQLNFHIALTSTIPEISNRDPDFVKSNMQKVFDGAPGKFMSINVDGAYLDLEYFFLEPHRDNDIVEEIVKKGKVNTEAVLTLLDNYFN